MNKEQIRHCIFKPYAKDRGPIFHLYLYDMHRYRFDGKAIIGYKLVMVYPYLEDKSPVTIFDDDDFSSCCLYAIDSDKTVKSLMSFITLRPGDTDSEYFDEYNDTQKRFCARHTEALAACVFDRFGE